MTTCYVILNLQSRAQYWFPSRCSLNAPYIKAKAILLPSLTPPLPCHLESFLFPFGNVISQLQRTNSLPVLLCDLPWMEGPLGTQPTRYCCNSYGLTAFPVTRYYASNGLITLNMWPFHPNTEATMAK